VKEVGLGLRDWDSFTIGGNSIGGYTAMGAAADDTTTFMSAENVSALGSTGSGRCRGLVLMNSAGRILSKDEVNDSENTVAETTALNLLGTSR
jgi:pimeloyl-ACP methyl ester carboxylesterase